MPSESQTAFFSSFSDFKLGSESLDDEFNRLAKQKGWSQESDVFRSFWRACFDAEPPEPTVSGRVKPRRTRRGGKKAVTKLGEGPSLVKDEASHETIKPTSSEKKTVSSLEEGLKHLELDHSTATSTPPSLPVFTPSSSMAGDGVLIRYFDTFPGFDPCNEAPLHEEFARLAAVQAWKEGSDIHRDQFLRCCTDEFNYFCGDASSRLDSWQRLCVDITGIEPPPSSKNQCRKVGTRSSSTSQMLELIDCSLDARIPFRQYLRLHRLQASG